MPGELYANDASTTVTTGGTGTPGTETWTVASSSGFPAASNSAAPPTQFHVADPALPSELMAVTNVSGTSWSVTRGDGGTTAVPHTAGFTVREVVSAGALVQLRDRVGWLNIVTLYGADPTGAADSTTVIQAAINAANTAGGGVVYCPRGTYKYSALTLYSGVSLIGDGVGVSTLNCSATSGTGITMQAVTNVTISGLTVSGPGTGTGQGITCTTSGSAPYVCFYLDFHDLLITGFGSHGMYMYQPCVSVFSNITSATNGGRGFFFTGVPGAASGTSCTWTACYANGNALEGWYIGTYTYSTLNSCAADANANGYVIAGCQGVVLNACGNEATIAKNSLDGTGIKITADTGAGISAGCQLNSCWSYQNNAAGLWVTGGSQSICLVGYYENTPLGGATASIKTDAGTMSTIIGYYVSTTTALTTNTYNLLNDGAGGWTTAGTGYVSTINVYGLATFNAGTDTAGSAPAITPAFANGTASQLSDTTRDYEVYLQIATPGTVFTLAIGPTSTPANTVHSSSTPTAGMQFSVRLPAGWYLKWAGTSTTLATQIAIGC